MLNQELRPIVPFRKRGGLTNILNKLQQPDRTVTIGYFGGSITDANNGWREKTFAWFEQAFPATVRMVNAAIGGTGSNLGVFRMDGDLLEYEPDLVFVEFAVNDSSTDAIEIIKSIEGIIRKAWNKNPEIDICFVYTITENLKNRMKHGKFWESALAHETVVEHYGIPSIFMGFPVLNLFEKDQLIFKVNPDQLQATLADGKVPFSHDSVHPIEYGHQIYSNAVIQHLPQLFHEGSVSHELKAPMLDSNWEKGIRISPDSECVRFEGNWKELLDDDKPQIMNQRGWPDPLWEGHPGDVVSLEFTGTTVAIQDIIGPSTNQIEMSIDGEPLENVSRYDRFCYSNPNRIAYHVIASELKAGKHVLTITVSDQLLDKKEILSESSPELEPKDPTGKLFYLGKFMVA